MATDHPHHPLQHLVIHLNPNPTAYGQNHIDLGGGFPGKGGEVVGDGSDMDEEWFEVYEEKGLIIFTTEQLEKLLHMIPSYQDYIIVPASS
jgi:hypothetical protein